MIARERAPYVSAVVVLAVGLAVTAALVWVSASQYSANENRLLALRAHDVGSVLTEVLPSIQTPLGSAAALADDTHGSPGRVRSFLTPYVGTGGARPFISVSVWWVDHPSRGPIVVVGASPVLGRSMARTKAFFAQAGRNKGLSVIGWLKANPPRLGYAFTGAVPGPFVAYGESALPSRRYSPAARGSPFSDLDYALYLGPAATPSQLLAASVHQLPLRGRRTTVRVAFGSATLTLVVRPHGPLAGRLPQVLPWAIAILGVLLSLATGALAKRLIDRRRRAEGLAGRLREVAEENRRLYAEQRDISQTLQHSLLPERLPDIPGLQVGARFEAGAEGVEIGGDWYDLLELAENRLLLVIGDVSGRGLRAASTMACLRYAIHAYAAQGDPPARFLPKLSRLVSVSKDGQLATLLCAQVDVAARQVSLTSAGHLPALMVANGQAQFLHGEVGLPVGVDAGAAYTTTTLEVPAGATLIAFTDGLVERRGESIDQGLERLRQRAYTEGLDLDELLGRILDGLRHDAFGDDAAIAGLRWLS